MHLIYFLIAFGSGSFVPLQALINGGIGSQLGHPLYGAITNFTVGLLALLTITALARPAFNGQAALSAAPWYLWMGGFFGAAFITGGAFVAPKIGAAAFLALVVAGQMLGSLVIDQFGILQSEATPVTARRLLGALLIIGGVLLVVRKAA